MASMRATNAHSRTQTTTRWMTRLNINQALPRQPLKLSAVLPASAIETGSQASAPQKEAKATRRSTVPRALSNMGIPATEVTASAATALPTGNPPNKLTSRTSPPHTSKPTDAQATTSSANAAMDFMSLPVAHHHISHQTWTISHERSGQSHVDWKSQDFHPRPIPHCHIAALIFRAVEIHDGLVVMESELLVQVHGRFAAGIGKQKE